MLFNLNYNIKINIFEDENNIIINPQPFAADVYGTFSFVYNVLNSNYNQYGVNETLYNECIEWVKTFHQIYGNISRREMSSANSRKPIIITGVSYGGAISQILALCFYNLKYNLDVNPLQFFDKMNSYVDLPLPKGVYSFGSFRIGNGTGIKSLKDTGIPIYNYVSYLNGQIDTVSLLPSSNCCENLNTIYYDIENSEIINLDTSSYNQSLFQNLLYLGNNIYQCGNWLNGKELYLHNCEIYDFVRSKTCQSI
jgi:hypothetical protein